MRDKLRAVPETIPPKLFIQGQGMNLPAEVYHEKTDSRDRCIGAVSHSAICSNYKHAIHNVL